MNPVGDVKSEEQLNEKLLGAKKDLVVIHFWAPWAEQCTQMNNAMEELAKQYVRVHFLKVEAEELPEVSQKFEIAAVPTFIFLKNRTRIDRLDGAHVPELEKLVQRNVDAVAPSNAEDDSKASLAKKLKSLINASACVLFMKGTADAPRCGFSRQTVEILRKHNCDFTTFDILEAPDVRQGLKEYSNWPTYPQLYIDGKLLGGLDIIKEMEEDSELDEQLPKIVKKAPLEERLKGLISREKVMVFMKGDPDGPRCGFSKKIVEILKQTGAKFGHFDILSDEEVRQGLKTFSNWPTYPQLYINGELIGGLDIVKEMHEEGELADSLQ